VALFGWLGREPPHIGVNIAYDQSYMRRMSAHHAQGIEIALIGAERADAAHLRALARLMAAAQAGDNAIFDQWWRSWFDSPPPTTPEDHAAMPGMLSPEQIESLRRAKGAGFDPLFVSLMSFHHRGAIAMADETLVRAGDPRLRIMAHAIRHVQLGEIELMRGAEGLPAVWAALRAHFASPDLMIESGPDAHHSNR